MTDKDLQRLKRGELLEILLAQSKEIESLKLLVEEKDQMIDTMSKKLKDRTIELQEAGSIAEASFKLNGVFEAAQNAAQQYLENIQALHDREKNIIDKKEDEVQKRCMGMLQIAQENCDNLKETTEKACADLETSTRQKCIGMEAEVKQKCQEIEAATDYKCRQREKEAEDKCIALNLKAKEEVEARWNELSTRLEDFYNAHQGLRELLALSKIEGK